MPFIMFSRHWAAPSDVRSNAEFALASRARYERHGWKHIPGTKEMVHGLTGSREQCGCPDCHPAAYDVTRR